MKRINRETDEVFELFKEFHNTNFCELKQCKLLDVNEHSQTARVWYNRKEMEVPIKMHHIRLDTLLELGNYYGLPAFLDKSGQLVDYSYITDELLTPVNKVEDGVDVYE